MNTFADRLRHARTARDLTQAELALASGLSQSAIANYENGSRRSTKYIFALAEALQVDPQWLAHGKGSMEAPLYGNLYAGAPASRQDASPSQLHERHPQETSWPFVKSRPGDYWSLDTASRTLIENTVATLIASLRK